MGDQWQSDWFLGVGGQMCRIVYEEKGSILHEFLEYQDQRRDRFQWQGPIISGFNYTRMGNRCVEVPEHVMEEMNGFLNNLGKGSMIIRNGTKVWKR